ncbi:MAG: AAA domain-containing protein [Polyangiales bacterium]
MSSSLDPLRYGLRALDAMARSRASVAVPPRVDDDAFGRELRLRPPPPEGAAMSLRLFSDVPDDATALVTGERVLLTLSPPPGRAVPLFEAQAAARQWDDDDGLSLGLPLVTFTQHGMRRAAPLFSVAARAVWRAGEGEWKAPMNARWGATLDAPTAMVISVDEEGGAWSVHAGVWDALFGLEADALAAIARVGDGDLGALVRTATKVLGAEGEADEALAVPAGPLTRDDLRALGEVVTRVAHPRAELSCAPHALLTLAPQGDPTRGLRAELKEMLKEPAPRSGPLGVFLGAKARRGGEVPAVSRGEVPPTPSQVLAAARFEGAADLVAVRGPPGCGKTALLHHLAAHVITSCALDATWARGPGEREAPWALVVSSTNNHAVDHALAPFVTVPEGVMPAGLRLGNRRVLEEVTLPTLLRVAACLSAPGETLPEARARFDAAAAPWRTYLAQRASRASDRAAHASRAASLRVREEILRAALATEPPPLPASLPSAAALDEACDALAKHVEAAHKLVKIHLHGAKASTTRARETWEKANRNRGAAITKALDALEIATPFGPLGADPGADIAAQITAMGDARARLDAVRGALRRAEMARELDEVTRALDALPGFEEPEAPLPDPALAPLALAVRDAWARTHRGYFLRHIADLRARFEEVSAAPARRRPLSWVLRALSPLFPVAGCTLLSLRASFPLDDDVITRVVIDEAGQCAPVYAAPALRRATRAMLTGDTAQLPPVYALDDRFDARLARDLDAKAVAPFRMGTSAMTSAQAVAEQRVAPVALVEHFRSQPEIVTLASSWSGYALEVRTPARSLAHLAPWLRAPALLLAVEGRGERGGDGVVNESEARRAVAAVERLLRDGVDARDIAVLTPFVGQSTRIERALRAAGVAGEHGVLVRTVHRLQGGERRVVVLSVTATAPRHLRWLEEHPHLLHVATSRAQDHLVVLASPVALASPGLAPLAALPRIGQPSGVRSESAR